MKNILVTGATGFIGRALVPKLAESHKVLCFARKTSDTSSLKGLANVAFVFGDITDKESIFQAVQGVDAVIHMAITATHANRTYGDDLIGAKNIIEACRKHGVAQAIFISSMAAKRKNLDRYGRAKLEMEKLFRESGLQYTILRPSMVYGNGHLALIGKSLASIPFIMPVIGSGNYKMSPVYIGDVVDAICKSLHSKIAVRKEYDVAGAAAISFNEILRICRKHFGVKKVALHVPVWLCALALKVFPVIDPEAIKGVNEDTHADITLMEKELGIYPRSFEDGIKMPP